MESAGRPINRAMFTNAMPLLGDRPRGLLGTYCKQWSALADPWQGQLEAVATSQPHSMVAFNAFIQRSRARTFRQHGCPQEGTSMISLDSSYTKHPHTTELVDTSCGQAALNVSTYFRSALFSVRASRCWQHTARTCVHYQCQSHDATPWPA